MGLLQLRTHRHGTTWTSDTYIQVEVSKDIPTYNRTLEYLDLGNTDRIPNIQGYPNIS